MKKRTISKRKIKEEAMNLCDSMAIYAIPRIKWLEENTASYPQEVESLEEWKSILMQMREGFEEALAYTRDMEFKIPIKERKARVKKGLDLFSQYYMELWD